MYKSARKITTKVQVYQLFAKHESEPGNHHDRFAVAVLQGDFIYLESFQELLGTS